MDMRSPVRPLKHGPERLQGVHVGFAVGPLLAGMFDRQVIVPKGGKDFVRGPFVGADRGPGLDALEYRRNEAKAGSVRNNLGEQFAITLKNAHDNGFALGTAPGESVLFAVPLAADIGFIDFNVIGKRRIAVNRAHVFADQMGHTERRGVGNAQLALQFLGRDAMPRRGEQIHGVKPLLKGRMGLVKRRSNHRVNVMAAPRAGISLLLPDPGKFAVLGTLRAINGFAVAKLHQVIKAGVVIGELLEKILNGWAGEHCYLLLLRRY